VDWVVKDRMGPVWWVDPVLKNGVVVQKRGVRPVFECMLPCLAFLISQLFIIFEGLVKMRI
jgi:hypothetical protein